MIPLLAQAESGPDPDLTRPLTIIAVCALVIVVALVVRYLRTRNRSAASPEEADATAQ